MGETLPAEDVGVPINGTRAMFSRSSLEFGTEREIDVCNKSNSILSVLRMREGTCWVAKMELEDTGSVSSPNLLSR